MKRNAHHRCRFAVAIVLLLFVLAMRASAQTYIAPPATLTTAPAAGSYYSNYSITLNPNFTFTAASGSSLNFYIVASDCIPQNISPSANQTYILTSIPRTGGMKNTGTGINSGDLANRTSCELTQTIQYLDGLGRPLQNIQVKGSPLNKDIVQHFLYDEFGREATKYQPYVSTSIDGSYRSSAPSELSSFYNPTGNGVSGSQQTNGIVVNPSPYSLSQFEPSPLNRVTEQGAPGTPWQPVLNSASGHTVKKSYTTNNLTAVSDTVNGRAVVCYIASINANQSRTLTSSGNYPAGQLYVTITKDENNKGTRGGSVEEYKDLEGHVVLKRTFNFANGALQVLSTYYVYDDMGKLAFVLPPSALPDNGVPSKAMLDAWCYQYRYDERGRLGQKKVPGAGWEVTIYNKLNQPVLSQDSVQRLTNQWAVTKYDGQGRVIVTGLWNAGSVIARSALQSSIEAGAQWDVRDNTNVATGYNLTSYPTLSTVLTVNYYDDYAFNGNPYTAFTNSLTIGTTGLVTGSKVAILNADGTFGQMLWEVHGYDGFGRATLTIKQHYKGGSAGYNTGNMDITTTTYNFDHQIDHSTFAHILSGVSNPKVGVGTQYYYDHMGRQQQIWKVIWDESLPQPDGTLISQTDYNELGQVKTKHLHSPDKGTTFKQDINYTYNERGWLSAINNPNSLTATQLFGEQLTYNSGTSPQYNGNIASMTWQTTVPTGLGLTQQLQSYSYYYDQLNRLLNANYTTTGSVGKFNERLDYDPMGNINHLWRTNTTTVGTYLNAFTYDYTTGGTGNRLWGVTDAGTAAQSGNYTYDGNGNVTKDTKNQVTAIAYNRLNLPATVTRTPGNISYVYDATGEKLQKIAGGIPREYIDGIEYNNGVIEFVTTEDGRATPNGNAYVYEYYLKDHLGNTRAAIRQDGTISQVQDYYAFGMDMNPGNSYAASPLNNYKYNGKEKQETGDYDYGARFYDPGMARWTSIDPMAEVSRRFSPYNYVENNPVRNIDPDGMLNEDYQEKRETLSEGAETLYGDEARAFFDRLKQKIKKKHEDPHKNGKDEDPVIKAWKLRKQKAAEKYGKTGLEQAKHFGLWWDMLWGQGPFEPNPYQSNATIANNPVATLVEGPIGIAAELGETAKIAQLSEKSIEESVSLVMKDQRKLSHIFDVKHKFAGLIQKLGSEENVVREVLKAANGQIKMNMHNDRITVQVAGEVVSVGGKVVNGVFRVGSMWVGL
ncbi:RHS repeat-associated protein [Mucilaginibacter sp. SG538B]|uniref:DUF6443 domain-containing protein n=1 Tax=Mucilaginibacter sp. SG538B TaxID=2587021 RepID=UPI00159EA5AC|nr:DUF6443 domain-containing protein [Mucilaginibacter sp. SG538B]NVM62170.1 RHS repeat-associated protein [Mucilaginibacter sp. SG538B]